jgi:hypothetical protein
MLKEKEIKQPEEYQMQRLVLDAWNKLVSSMKV